MSSLTEDLKEASKLVTEKYKAKIKNIKLQEKPVAKKKRKKRTIQDIIEDIRELHDKEEDLLIDLEEKADDLDNNEGEE